LPFVDFEEIVGKDSIIRISKKVSKVFEAAKYIKEYDGKKTLIFDNIKGSSFKLISNLFLNRNIIYKVLGACNEIESYKKLIYAMDNPSPPKIIDIGEFAKIDKLSQLPILKFYEKDGNYYITSSIVFAKDPETGFQNASIHRLMYLDDKHLAIRIVPRHLWRIYNKYKRNKCDTPISIVVGTHLPVYIAAATSPPYGVDELHVANRIMNNSLKLIITHNDILVPANSDFIIKGKILHDKYVDEGPFTDITGTYDIVRKQPVIKVDEILVSKSEPFFYQILPAGVEHKLLMGYPREAAIWKITSQIADIKSVRLTSGGCSWLHAVISISKKHEGEPTNVILAAFTAHPSLKRVIVVDDDINVDDPNDVEWALATRVQPAEDIVIINRARGSSLDPSSDQIKMLTSKWGIDATIPLDKNKDDFIKAKIP